MWAEETTGDGERQHPILIGIDQLVENIQGMREALAALGIVRLQAQ